MRLWNMLGGCSQLLDRFYKMLRHGDEERFWESEYVPDYTSKQEDEAWSLVQRSGILALCQNPFLLRVIAAIFEAEGEVPGNRSTIFATSVQTLIRRELERVSVIEGWYEERDRIEDAEENV